MPTRDLTGRLLTEERERLRDAESWSYRFPGGLWLVNYVEIGGDAAERLWAQGVPHSLPDASLVMESCFGPFPEDQVVAVERREDGRLVAILERHSPAPSARRPAAA
jgi:hypothetical protein